MSYLALARKWRPRTFSQLIGQEHVNKPLINALTQQRVHHAYLFTGTRGVGKTSVARILAKALNCEIGINPTPCLACDTCLSIEQGRFVDLIEIDGASKTRVEDTRDLLDNVHYSPTIGRFKIYLIDEVHMLSQHSFNALLKTLEEPPLHVKFILATTDPKKLPVTVLSRCLQFNLNPIPPELIKQQLQLILDEEKLPYESECLDILAYAADGSMRDALSLLDQVISGCTDKLYVKDVKLVLGYTQQDYALQLLRALARQDAGALLDLNQHIVHEGGQFHYVLDELLHYLHQLSVYKAVGSINPLLSYSSHIVELAPYFSAEDIQLFYQIGLKGVEEISLAPTLAIGFNMTVLRMLLFRPAAPVSPPPLAYESSSNIKAPHSKLTPQMDKADFSLPEKIEELVSKKNTTTSSLEQPKEIETTSTKWTQIISQLNLSGLALNALDNAEFVFKKEKLIQLKVAKGHQSLFTPSCIGKIELALSEYYKGSIKIQIQAEEKILTSPALQKEKLIQEKQNNASLSLDGDPTLQLVKNEFSAKLVKNSISSLKDDI